MRRVRRSMLRIVVEAGVAAEGSKDSADITKKMEANGNVW